MPKFRKKPVVIEAVQWTGDNIEEIDQLADKADVPTILHKNGMLYIRTLEGTMEGSMGDWIIKGVQGEMYPCKPDVFAATYERVEE